MFLLVSKSSEIKQFCYVFGVFVAQRPAHSAFVRNKNHDTGELITRRAGYHFATQMQGVVRRRIVPQSRYCRHRERIYTVIPTCQCDSTFPYFLLVYKKPETNICTWKSSFSTLQVFNTVANTSSVS